MSTKLNWTDRWCFPSEHINNATWRRQLSVAWLTFVCGKYLVKDPSFKNEPSQCHRARPFIVSHFYLSPIYLSQVIKKRWQQMTSMKPLTQNWRHFDCGACQSRGQRAVWHQPIGIRRLCQFGTLICVFVVWYHNTVTGEIIKHQI